jgi:hypothetical protein
VANEKGFAMAAAVGLRKDYEAAGLRTLAKRSVDAAQTWRLLALAMIYNGGTRTEAAKLGGVGLQTVRDWVLAFNAEGRPGRSMARRRATRRCSPRRAGRRCLRWSRTVRSRRFTASSAVV